MNKKDRSDGMALVRMMVQRYPALTQSVARESGATEEEWELIEDECDVRALTPSATFAWHYSKMAVAMLIAPVAGVALVIRMVCIALSSAATIAKSVPAYAAMRFLPESIAQRVWWTTRPMHASYYKMVQFPVWEEQIMRFMGWRQGARPRTRGFGGWCMAALAFFIFLPVSLVMSVFEFAGFVIEFASCLLSTALGFAVVALFPAELSAMTSFFIQPYGLKMQEYKRTEKKRNELIAM
jgi:hypothetical protein